MYYRSPAPRAAVAAAGYAVAAAAAVAAEAAEASAAASSKCILHLLPAPRPSPLLASTGCFVLEPGVYVFRYHVKCQHGHPSLSPRLHDRRFLW